MGASHCRRMRRIMEQEKAAEREKGELNSPSACVLPKT